MSAQGKEYRLAVKIAGQIDKTFGASLASANTALKVTIDSVDKEFTRLDNGFGTVMSGVKSCLSAVATAAAATSVAIGTAAAASITAGSQFESAFAGVKKTVEATEDEYAKLKKEVLDMSRVIPEGASEIASVMETAGQLGIGKESLSDFAETMVRLGAATNLSAVDASSALARFANITNMADYDSEGESNFKRLGSVIVDLGNNFATTESEIVDMATNLAATGDLVGLSEAQIMALATAMSSTGIEAEKGGTAASKLLKKIQLAVETNSGALEDYARVAGMTGKEFASAFSDDAIVAFSAFIEGLNDTGRNGRSAISILDEMGLSEIRLSDVILRLANANGLMSTSIETANKAWDENTALTIETKKRFETFDSSVQLMKNSFSELGIAVYDNLIRTPAADIIQGITQSVNNFVDVKLDKWIDGINKELPTLKRLAGNAIKTVEPLFGALLDAGKWCAKNPNVISGVIVGIGTALATYKIASSVTHIVKAIAGFKSLNPVTAGIMAAVTAIGAIAGVVAAAKAATKELVDRNLEQHFGDITLSLEDLDKVARNLLDRDGSLKQLQASLAALDKLDGLQESIDSATEAIGSANWKVSVGMELDEDDAAEYKTAIDEYVSACNEYVAQQQYAVILALKFYNEYDIGAVSTLRDFYDRYSGEMARLGTELQEVVNNAFEDGLFGFDEVKKISEIQGKMAKIQAELAGSEFKARLQLLKSNDYGKVTPDTYKNIVSTTQGMYEETLPEFDKEYITGLMPYQTMLDNGEISKAEYDDKAAGLKSARMRNIAGITANMLEFQTETIMEAYSEEISEVVDNVNAKLDEFFVGDGSLQQWQDSLPNTALALYEEIDEIMDSLGSDAKGAIVELYEIMKPSLDGALEKAQEFRESGEMVPETLKEQIKFAEAISLFTEDTEALGQYILTIASENDEYMSLFKTLSEQGYNIEGFFGDLAPALYDYTSEVVGITDALNQNAQRLEFQKRTLDDYLKTGFKTLFSESTAPEQVPAAVTQYSKPTSLWDDTAKHMRWPASTNLKGVAAHAEGGIFDRPHFALFAEEGPEAVIPIRQSQGALKLWERTGQLLGMPGVFEGMEFPKPDGGIKIEYKPQLVFNGDSPGRADIDGALEISEERFAEMLERYIKGRIRTAF